MNGPFRGAALISVLFLCVPGSVAAECPPEQELLGRIREVDFRLGARSARFAVPPPVSLYGKAAKKVGRPYAMHKAARGFAVMVAPLPVERLWMALNDEDHHALDDGYLPVKYSEVIEGTPRGASRLLFQYYQRMGVGRWWVSRVWMNRELYERTGGAMWEVLWEDRTDEVDPALPPMNRVSSRLRPIRQSKGAWLLVPIAPECTLIEHFSWSEPGGMAGALRALVIDGALRDTAVGLARMATEHVGTPHAGASFVRPDGTPLVLSGGSGQ